MAPLLEALEERLAPAGLNEANFEQAVFRSDGILLTAGQGLQAAGAYMLYVESGQARVFLTDLNGNGQVDFNEVTGISAGDGLRLISFVDINGDIITNLNPDGTLTDYDPATPGNDGRVVLNSRIDSIVMRALTADDVSGNYMDKLAPTTFSIYGNIYAGGGLGTPTSTGLVIDTAGWSDLTSKFNGNSSREYLTGAPYPTVGYIVTGSAVSGHVYSFGAANGFSGKIATFVPSAGQIGGDVYGVRVGDGASLVDSQTTDFTTGRYQIGGIFTGNGGAGARGGDIHNVTLYDDIGGFRIVAGNGGDGVNGGNGGSIHNFADLGSHNSYVLIQTGDGGFGYNGKGGHGGSLSLGQFATTASVEITLGNGGGGTLAGGNGASLESASFTPTSQGELPIPLNIVTTYRNVGDIGTPHQIDFNNDGIGDIVYISDAPNQLVVKLGEKIQVGVDDADQPIYNYGVWDGSPTFYLQNPHYAESSERSSALAVANFGTEADPILGIITASSAENSRDGIYVYLWDSSLNNGTGGFTLPVRSSVPFFNIEGFNFLKSGGAITDIVVGDFDNDGKVDIAYTGQYRTDLGALYEVTSLVVMKGTGDGHFYVDFSYDPNTQTRNALPITNIATGKNAHQEVIIESTAAQANNKLTDLIVVSPLEDEIIETYNFRPSGDYSDGQLTEIASAIPQVKEREGGAPVGKSRDATPIDFTVMDVNGDGLFDIVTLTDDGYLVAFKGDADGNFQQDADKAGILLTGKDGVLGQNTNDLNGFFKGIVSGNFDGNSATPDIGIYTVPPTGNVRTLGFYTFTITGIDQDSVAALGFEGFSEPQSTDQDVIAFNTYQGKIDPNIAAGFIIGTPNSTKYNDATIQIGGPGGKDNPDGILNAEISYSDVYQQVIAGSGGNSLLGAGGAGGSIGAGVIQAPSEANGMPNASIQMLIPSEAEFNGAVFTFVAGNGGNGFTGGGKGGSVTGFATRFTGNIVSTVNLVAGQGGDAVLGNGGNGGDISKISAQGLVYAFAGNGGDGNVGGNGGHIISNGISNLLDSERSRNILKAGDGGDGIVAGGNGGSIDGFKNRFPAIIEGAGGVLSYTAGSGGNAVSGKGGTGGSVTNASPYSEDNNLSGSIAIIAGSGGNGLAGGNGGSIANFINNSTTTESVKAISFIAGSGGIGISQNGGNGGSIINVKVSGTGVGGNVADLPFDPPHLSFNRFIAGAGGDSYGAAGGNGGSISSLESSSSNSSLAIAAGAGGSGVSRGGVGGDVLNSRGNAAGSPNKVLVIAGDGGDAYGFTAQTIGGNAPAEQKALIAYGSNGVGGNGGNISGFTQPGAVKVITDLIAGNGGNLINYGNPNDPKAAVGKGGSISKVNLKGDAGDILSDQAIKSYNALGTTMAEFVRDVLAADSPPVLTNALGNVGVVAGSAGRVAVAANPATGGYQAAYGTNGSVTDFTAENIMSMVAGSVDRIAAILTISNINVASGGVVGAYKNTPVMHPADQPYYYTGPGQTGASTSTATVGGSLMDGAVLAINNKTNLSSTRIFTAQ